MVYGRDPVPLIKANKSEEPLRERDLMLDELRYNLVKSQLHMKEVENRKRRDVEFEVGELVYLKLQP